MGIAAIQNFSGLMIEVAMTIGLDPEGQDRKQQVPRQVRGRRWLENALPPGAQSLEIEIAQMRDLVFYGCPERSGGGESGTVFARHCITPRA
jgi:hypothetical protein